MNDQIVAVANEALATNLDPTLLPEPEKVAFRDRLARELIDLDKSILPQTSRIELISELLRKFGPNTIILPGKGKVAVSKESVAGSKGFVPEVQLPGWNALSQVRRTTLIKEGIVALVEVFSQNRKASVKITHNV